MSDWSRTKTSFVREDTTANTFCDSCFDTNTSKTAGYRCRIKCASEDCCKSFRNSSDVYNDNDKAVAAFAASKQVVGEIDMTVNQMVMAMEMQKHMIAPQDSTLSKVLTVEEFVAAKKFFEQYSPQPVLRLK